MVICSVLPILGTVVCVYGAKNERTTMRGGNGTPYLLLACAHLSMGREFGLCVECVSTTCWSWLRGVRVRVGCIRVALAGGPTGTSIGGVTRGSWIDLRMNTV